jgi:hypothetical protein
MNWNKCDHGDSEVVLLQFTGEAPSIARWAPTYLSSPGTTLPRRLRAPLLVRVPATATEQFQRVVAVIDEEEPPICGCDGNPEQVPAHPGRVDLDGVDLYALWGRLHGFSLMYGPAQRVDLASREYDQDQALRLRTCLAGPACSREPVATIRRCRPQ